MNTQLEIQRNACDIETGALPLAEIIHLKPQFAAPGNYKDPVKIAESIAAQEAQWLEKAALSPLTGRVLVIGVKPFGPHSPQFFEGDERAMLAEFWNVVGIGHDFVEWYGHNLSFFDLPFLIKRSWLHGLPVPLSILFESNGRYFNGRRFKDTMTTFQCGNRQDFVSLNTVGKFFGLGGKAEENSANFAALYATDREAALAHLARDLELTEGIASRMFAIQEAA